MRGLSLTEVDLRQTDVLDLSPLFSVGTLRCVHVDPLQFSEDQLGQLRQQSVSVLVGDAASPPGAG